MLAALAGTQWTGAMDGAQSDQRRLPLLLGRLPSEILVPTPVRSSMFCAYCLNKNTGVILKFFLVLLLLSILTGEISKTTN